MEFMEGDKLSFHCRETIVKEAYNPDVSKEQGMVPHEKKKVATSEMKFEERSIAHFVL